MEGVVPTLNYGAGNGYGDGGFGGSGIWAIVLIAALFGGRGGWGGFGGGGDCCGGGSNVRDAVDNAELNARFNSLEGQINNVNDLAQLRENYKESCDTNMNVTMQGSNVLAAVAEAKFDNAIIAKDAQLSAQACCCETNRHIDQVQFEAAKNTCEITSAIHAEGEATRALITADKIESVRKFKDAVYHVEIKRLGQTEMLIDNQPFTGTILPYQDGKHYQVTVSV